MPDKVNPFVKTSSIVDKTLLNGKYHSEAHEECRQEFLNQAKEVFDIKDPLAYFEVGFLLYNGIIKTHQGYDSKLYEKPPGDSTMHISKIEMEKEIQSVWWFRKIRGKAIVSVVDEKNKPVPGATVSGLWSGNAINKCSAITNYSGKVILLADWFWSRRGRFIFNIKNIKHKDREYAPDENKQTSCSIDIWTGWR